MAAARVYAHEAISLVPIGPGALSGANKQIFPCLGLKNFGIAADNEVKEKNGGRPPPDSFWKARRKGGGMKERLSSGDISRREFLFFALAASSCCFLSSPLGIKLTGAASWGSGENYYQAHRQELLQAFRETNAGAREYLAAKYGEDLARKVCREAAYRFRDLLPQLPEVGGARNRVIQDLPIAGWYAAYYRPMKAQGRTAAELGRMIYDLNARDLAAIPKDKARARGASRFTPVYVQNLRDFCAWTRKREYPGNWVATFVPGDGKNFDYGYDYSECAIVKYLKAQGALEVAPYVCLNDFLRSRTYGTGLHRTQTIAQGDALCNFRYKQGRPVTQDWSTEVPKFKGAT